MAINSDKKSEHKEVLERAKKRFELAAEAESEIRTKALEDLKFRAGEQWPEEIKYQRQMEGRPCLTINRLPQFVKQVTNDQRQNRPSMQVNPVDNEADVDTAEIFQGLIRHIEYDSNAEIAYDRASDGQATHGFGYFRIVTDYCDPLSFDQDIKIKSIRDPFSVFIDPSYQEPDGSDSNFCFIIDELLDSEYKTQYPDSELSQMEDWASLGLTTPGWVTSDGARLAEYFEKVLTKKTICLLANGETIEKEELASFDQDELPPDFKVISERETEVPEIKWYKINGIEVLEETTFPGDFIPIIPVLGDELIIEGRKTLEGVIRHAKDSQRMYNYWATAETEAIALAPKSPFIGAEGQFEGHEGEWKTANTKSHAYLQYKPITIGGQQAPPPERSTAEPAVQAITNARMQSAEDLKATTGIYDASLGNRSNEETGIAIQRRNTQSQTANFHYADNFTRSLRHAGRIIVRIIPEVYDTPRAVRIVRPDGEQEVVQINQIFQEKDGSQNIYQLNKGTYDVTVSTGPSYQTKRQEAVASMLQLVKAYPNLIGTAGDLLVKSMDWEGAQEIAARLKKMLPPQLQDTPENQNVPQQVQQQIQQMRQMIQALTTQLTQSNDIIRTKKLELESKERIEAQKQVAEMQRELMLVDATHAKAAFEGEVKTLHKRLDILGENIPIGSDMGAGPQGSQAPTQMKQPTGGQSPGPNMGA